MLNSLGEKFTRFWRFAAAGIDALYDALSEFTRPKELSRERREGTLNTVPLVILSSLLRQSTSPPLPSVPRMATPLSDSYWIFTSPPADAFRRPSVIDGGMS